MDVFHWRGNSGLRLRSRVLRPAKVCPGNHNFLAAATTISEPLELPVMGSLRGYRDWAVRVGKTPGIGSPATPVWTTWLDAIFLHRIWGPVIFGWS